MRSCLTRQVHILDSRFSYLFTCTFFLSLLQYNALRATLRFLRMENSYLKGHDLIREIQELPVIPEPKSRVAKPNSNSTPNPNLKSKAKVKVKSKANGNGNDENEVASEPEQANSDSDSDSSSDSESSSSSHGYDSTSSISSTYESSPSSHAPLLSLATETKMLYRSVIKFSSSPRVVDLGEVNRMRLEAGAKAKARRERVDSQGVQSVHGEGGGGESKDGLHEGGMMSGRPTVWMPRKKMPAQQVLERRIRAERLGRRVRGLVERVDGYKLKGVSVN